MKSLNMVRALLVVSIYLASFASMAKCQSTDRKQSRLSADDDSMKRLVQSELGIAPGFDIADDAKALGSKDRQKRGLMDLPKEVAGGLVPNQVKGVSTGGAFRPGADSFDSGFDGIEVKQTESLGRLPQGTRWLSDGLRARVGSGSLPSPRSDRFSINAETDSPKKIWKGE